MLLKESIDTKEQVECPKCGGRCDAIYNYPEFWLYLQKKWTVAAVLVSLLIIINICSTATPFFATPASINNPGLAVIRFLLLSAIKMAIPALWVLLIWFFHKSLRKTSFMCSSCCYIFRNSL
jgi:hypothetical protein